MVVTDYQKNGCAEGTGGTHALACEAAAEATMTAWLGPSAGEPASAPVAAAAAAAPASAAAPLSQASIVGAKRKLINFAEDGGAQCNGTAMLHMYLSAVAAGGKDKDKDKDKDKAVPSFELAQVRPNEFSCVLRLSVLGKRIESHGRGASKVIAKRVASGEVLK
jgi:hypothetical protein